MLSTIATILRHIHKNRKELSESKSSGVHAINGVYKIHESNFIPRALAATLKDTDIRDVVDIAFPLSMEWDSQSLWLTMH
jgi:hypothetical protein